MPALSPANKAFLGVFVLSCLAHIAVFGLPLSRWRVDVVAPDASAIDAASAPTPQPIAIATLPSSASAEVSALASSQSPQPEILLQPTPQSPPAQGLLEAPVLSLAEPVVEPRQVPVPSEPQSSEPQSSEPRPSEPQPSPVLASEPEQLEPEPLEGERPAFDQLESAQLEPELSEPPMIVSVGDNFPHLAGAQGNCYNLASCYRLSDAGGYRQAAKALAEQMEDQGYTVNEREDIDGAGRRVFEVVMPGAPDDIYFLNVFSDEVGSAVYVLTMDILTLRELQQLRA